MVVLGKACLGKCCAKQSTVGLLAGPMEVADLAESVVGDAMRGCWRRMMRGAAMSE